MKNFNITAQVYEIADKYKQTIFLNKEVVSECKQKAIEWFIAYFLVPQYQLVKIYSVEEFNI